MGRCGRIIKLGGPKEEGSKVVSDYGCDRRRAEETKRKTNTAAGVKRSVGTEKAGLQELGRKT